jgi:hypothetical protein
MDSKVVNRAIKKTVWPALRNAGFATFTSRCAWRHREDQIDVIEFQSFNKYNADVLGVTTFSFAVRMGTIQLYIPPQWPPKVKDGVQLPSEAECYFRSSMVCSIESKLKDRTIWPVDPAGKNLPWCIQGVLNKLPQTMSWFERLAKKSEVLRILQEENQKMPELWGFGSNPSPMRSYLAGYVALALGQNEIAETKLQEAADSKCFVSLFTSVQGAVLRAV